jgi:hypothetical protein
MINEFLNDGAPIVHKPPRPIALTSRKINSTHEGIDAKLLSALLTGIHRAFPYANLKDDSMFMANLDAIFRVCRPICYILAKLCRSCIPRRSTPAFRFASLPLNISAWSLPCPQL